MEHLVTERDYPVGHPASADYKGETYYPPDAPWSKDYPRDAVERGGGNCNALDTPDGLREHTNARQQDLNELRAIGALPAEPAPTDAQLKL